MADGITLLIGTTKGAFTVNTHRFDPWKINGPHCDGWSINHVVGDAKTGMIWAAGGGEFHGAGVWRSDDRGENWTLSKFANGQLDDWAASDPDMAKMFGWELMDAPFHGEVEAVWSLNFDHGVLHAGTKPAQLFSSDDNGANWNRIDALSDHPSRESWNPGGAGLILHSIVADPGDSKKTWVAISAAGVFATEDEGASWERRNRLSNAEAAPHDHHPAAPCGGETGHCVHNIRRAPGNTGDLLYQQNHHGVFRSRDGGRNWDDVTKGLPSTFGFPMGVHPRDPKMIWTLPLNGDIQGRFPPDASAAVWKSIDGGQSWEPKNDGLPKQDCFFTVLRQAMAVGSTDPAGVYFGTNTGSIFASHDEGERWVEGARHLPTILSVEVLE